MIKIIAPTRNLPDAYRNRGYVVVKAEKVFETPKDCGTKRYFVLTLKKTR